MMTMKKVKDVIGRKEYLKQWNKDNKEHIKEYKKEWYQSNRRMVLERMKEWQKNNPEHYSEYQNKYHLEHKEEEIEQKRKYHQSHKEESRIYQNNRIKTDLKCNLNNKISGAMLKSLKGNKGGKHWEDLVGYTLEDLKRHLGKTMPEGYNWQDYMEGRLHIDHKIPMSVFNFDQIGQLDFKRCWSLNNLQLLPAKENQVKSNHLTKPFQPALKI